MDSRYPGPQPFSDDDSSRLVFHGRDHDKQTLLNLVLANRLSVLYAKSGLGKTSLLRAGVAQLLRDEGSLPLLVRVNRTNGALLPGLVEDVGHEADRQGIEYRAGKALSLWHYFKTVEFWRGDLLLTPVLILDQFEELFTLQKSSTRTEFIRDLSSLVRGIRPTGSDPSGDREHSDRPPRVRVLISMREDFLGQLEETAESIPEILDHRFRLTPLYAKAAKEAMEAPASVDDGRFSTRPFRYSEGTCDHVITFLSRRTSDVEAGGHEYVEPFHLQLVCQRAERKAAERQRQGVEQVSVSFEDLGGEAGLKEVLGDFYDDVLQSIPERRVRTKVKRLCTQHLISPGRFRISMVQSEIEEKLGLDASTLRYLVNQRLLRSDQRADRSYFELSHDSLVEPVLTASRSAAVLDGALQLLGGIVVGLLALVIVVAVLTLPFFYGFELSLDKFASPAIFGIAFALVAGWLSLFSVRQGLGTLQRFSTVAWWSWLIGAYGLFVMGDWGYETARGFLNPAGARAPLLQLLALVRAAAFVGGSVALLGSRASTVFFFAAGLAGTIASSVAYYISLGDPFAVVVGSAVPISVEAFILVIVWRAQRHRSLNERSASIRAASHE